jgi:tetratricopeptide (TPR) repeat protein
LASLLQVRGRYQDSIKLFEKVRDQRIKTFGADHSTTSSTLNNLALAYLEVDRLDDAAAALDQAVANFVRLLGAEHPTTLNSKLNRANVDIYRRDWKSAIERLEEIRGPIESRLGAENPQTLTTLNNLAQGYLATGRDVEGMKLLRRVRETYLRTLGPDHQSTLTATSNLAAQLLHEGNFDQAVEMLLDVKNRRLKQLGPKHPSTLIVENNLGVAFQSQGRYEDAIKSFETVRSALLEQFGPGHPQTLANSGNLASTYLDAKRFDDAIRLLNETRAAWIKRDGPDSSNARYITTILVDANQRSGKHQPAIDLLAELLGGSPRARGDSVESCALSALLGESQLALEKLSEAEATLRTVVEGRRKLIPDDWRTFNAESMLGAALLGRLKTEASLPAADKEKLSKECERLLNDSYGRMTKVKPPAPDLRQAEAIDRLAAFYEWKPDAEQVGKWRGLKNAGSKKK